jgi:hypothetical protein
MALTSDGVVYAWGDNTYYQLGDYTTTDRYTAVEVTMIEEQYVVTSISAGKYHACVATLDGANLCYGYGVYGELGNGESTAASDVVYTVSGYEGTHFPTPLPTPLPTPVPTTNRTRGSVAVGVPNAGWQTLHVLDDDGGLW